MTTEGRLSYTEVKMLGKAILWVVVGLVVTPLGAQQDPPRKNKPKLIRNDHITEPVEPEVITPDPAEARRNIQVGDFYFKRGNLKAARARYSEAVKYGPKIAEGFSKLVKTLEQMDEWQAALETCRQFLEINPDSNEARHFQKKVEQLESKISG